MIFFSIGLPGRFAAWCDAVITRIVEIGHGPVELMPAESPDEIAIHLVRSRVPHLVIASRRPDPSLCTMLAEAGGPRIIALDDLRRVLRDHMAERGVDFRAATREMAQSSAAALVCTGLPGAVALHCDREGYDPSALVSTIAQSCGLGLDGGAVAAILAAIPLLGDDGSIEPWWGGLDPDQRALADGVLAGYGEAFRGGRLGEITWDRSLFWHPADPSRNAAEAFDLGDGVGRVIYGPEIGLPPGDWAASVTLAVSKEAVGIAFEIEIWAAGHHAPLARAGVAADPRGLCSATLAFAIGAPMAQTIVIVVANSAPAPGGRLAFGNVMLVPNPSHGADIPSELTMALGL